ncbi:hypothetical protein LPB136_13570 [Tenacibaculum todarodis]|uniref:Transglutaminase-like domain-containing protein n=1 Tax=Tenacibaculum todarodis TaxID=1850252 RepID=A0A1L3JMH3_9FLAO|nr:transglutaminase domain-containing protein [Tenacibaculum todarodis]APG63864.1 hypothetical protein LPB136_00095 [Tenacibaculum todarodis]APG66337.1 hypothetical protein LPB136_13570 [Tenacibaculum todarodis]
MKQLFFFFFLITISTADAQYFSTVDAKVKSYPKFISAEKLADLISEDFNSDTEKVRATYIWLTQNIRYDLAEYYSPTKTSYSFSYSSEEEKQQKITTLNNQIVSETLSSKKAVCEGYARVFAKICTLLKIENEFIKGYIRNSPQEIGIPIFNANHAWNAVKINDEWRYFDATWGAGHEENGKWKRSFTNYFFDIPTEKLFFTHFPEQTIWQLRVKRLSKTAFYKQPIYNHKFLNTNLTLVFPTSGVIKKNKEGYIEFQIKNLKSTQKVFVGFKGSRYSQKPKINFKESTGFIKIIPPKSSKEAYLIIDGNVVLEFLIQ